MIFDIVLSIVVAALAGCGAHSLHVLHGRADVLHTRISQLTEETYGALRGVAGEMTDHWDRWTDDVERLASQRVEIDERLAKWDAHDQAADAWRAEVRRRFTRIERDPTLPRDVFDANWNPEWGVVNGKWTRL